MLHALYDVKCIGAKGARTVSFQIPVAKLFRLIPFQSFRAQQAAEGDSSPAIALQINGAARGNLHVA